MNLFILVTLASSMGVGFEGPSKFSITFSNQVCPENFSGRVYVMTSSGRSFREPRFGPDWFRPSPFFSKDVTNVRSGETIILDEQSLGFPGPLSKLAPGTYTIQAVLDRNLGGRDFSNSPGNGYSKPKTITVGAEGSAVVDLHIDQVVSEIPFRETANLRLVDMTSPLLSRFHGRDVHLKASVALPSSYAQDKAKKYPIIYVIPGFSGTHMVGRFSMPQTNRDGVEFVVVTLNPDCPLGHHVFADSANNGPCGQSLIDELIPHIEKTYRIIGTPETRLVTGHSSGGWSSLWLQVAYPNAFGGVWSTSPDPVDFRDFQRINLYAPGENMFVDSQGNERPLARRGTTPIVTYRTFSDMEVVMGHGGQLASFEAVFSPRLSNGTPRLLWNRQTGAIDPETAEAWKKYDIRLKLEREWPTLGPKLKGKLHIYTGELDTFYLEGAVKLIKESLGKLGSDAKVEIIPGKDHGSILSREFMLRISKEMADRIRSVSQ